MINPRTRSIIFKYIVSLSATLAVFLTIIGTGMWEMFRMFTILTNAACAIYFFVAATDILIHKGKNGRQPIFRELKSSLMLSIFLVGAVSALLYSSLANFKTVASTGTVFAHIVTPVLAILDWLLNDSKGTFTPKSPFTWTILPIIYVIYIYTSAPFTDFILHPNCPAGIDIYSFCDMRYPYIFINYPALGIPTTIICLVGIALAYILCGYLFVYIDKKLANRH